MGTVLNTSGTYKYKIQFDGDVLKKGQKITLRRMADGERNKFLRKRAQLLADQVDAFAPKYLGGTAGSDDVERLHKEALKLGRLLTDGKGLRRIGELDDTANLIDLIAFIGHIIRTERFLENGHDAPDQIDILNIEPDDIPDDDVDNALEEAESLGEPGPPNESPTTTPVIDLPAETSSSTAGEDTPSTESPE